MVHEAVLQSAVVTVPEAFALALQHHQAGRLAGAEALCRQILAADPRHADAQHLLGVIAHQVGRNEVALEMILKAIALQPTAPAFHSNLGEAYRKLGRLDDAIAAYRRAIQLKPDFAEAHSNLGTALSGRGRPDEALAAFRRALEIRPGYAEAYSNMGNVLKDLGHFDQAAAAYRSALQIRPDYAEAHYNLGAALGENGQPDEAIGSYRRAIQFKPDYVQAHNNLGNALRDQGRLDEAIAAYRRTTELAPDFPEGHNNLGVALRDRGHPDEAAAACRRAIELQPDFAEAHYNLGNALKDQDQGRLDEAIAAYRRALQLRPDYAEAHCNLGNALQEQGRLDEALVAFCRAIELKPDFATAHYNLGNVLKEQGRFDEAIAAYRRVLALKPDFADAHNNLGNALKDQGHPDEAIAAYRRALALKPDFAGVNSNLLLTLHYLPDFDVEVLFREHRRWDEVHARPLAKEIAPHGNDQNPGRCLRIGYISPDFREHSVAFFAEPLMQSHDRSQVEVFCYTDLVREDQVTVRLRKCAGQWRRSSSMTDEQVADLIRKDGIDILVDLAGHTANTRLLVFARKPAPVQVTYLGYCDTTGLRAMDYRLTDALADPPGTTEHLHSEQLVRLPDTAWCFRPSDAASAVGTLPVLHSGHITFGCFNVRPKITDEALALWSGLLAKVPGSRLLLKALGFEEASGRLRMHASLKKAGITPERVELVGRVPTLAEHLALYNRMDIALDTFPYNGTTTTCEALWQGVPVVTLAGHTHASRVGVSLLSNVGLAELVAHSPEEYVKVAVALAANVSRLAELRSTLRERMAASPLMDAPRFTRNVEHAYREMWRAWCAKPCSNPTS